MRRSLFIAFICAVLILADGRSRAATITHIEYDIHTTSIDENHVRDLMRVAPGDILDQHTLDTRIETLSKAGVFNELAYEIIKGKRQNQVELKIIVKEAQVIANIKVSGAYPILHKDIRKLVLMQPGQAFDESLLTPSENLIRDYLEKNGYYNSVVLVSQEKHNSDAKTNLRVKIKKGKGFRVDEITLMGADPVREDFIRNKVSKSSRFRMTRLKANLKSIRRHYIRKGFVRARVDIDKLEFNEDKRTVDITLSIKENKKLSINFTGKKLFSAAKLKSVLNFKENRSYDRFAIEESVYKLRQFYQTSGYPDAQIEIAKRDTTDESVHVVYHISAGRRVELSAIDFRGNASIRAKKLKKQMRSRESSFLSRSLFQTDKLFGDRTRIEKYYREQGYLDATVNAPSITSNSQGDQRQAVFEIEEGKAYRIKSVRIDADEEVDNRLLKKRSGLRVARIIRDKDIDDAATRLLEALQRQGYAYAKVDIETALPEDSNEQKRVDIVIHIKRGPLVRIGKIITSGHFATKEKIINRNFRLKPGDLFIYQEMLDAQQRLRRLGIFSSVSAQPLGFETESAEVDLLITVAERKSITVEMEAGFDTINYASGEISFSKRNLFGLAKQLNIRAIGGLRFDRLETTFISPRIFGASWNLANQYFGQYEDNRNFNAVSFGSSLSMLKNYGPYWTLGLREQIIKTNILETSSNQNLGTALFDNTLNELQATVSYDIRDNYSDPQKGINAYVKNELSIDVANDDNIFYTLEANLAHYQGFLKRFTLVNTLRYWHVFKLRNSAIVPANKLFFLGGDDSLRGFEQDAVDDTGGRVAMIYNAELQFRVFDSFKIAGFFDAGSLTDSFEQMNRDSFRESAGAGIRYFTPIGPIRLDLGFILDRKTGEPERRLHFSFGYFF